jgi:hypothetical protein
MRQSGQGTSLSMRIALAADHVGFAIKSLPIGGEATVASGAVAAGVVGQTLLSALTRQARMPDPPRKTLGDGSSERL